MHNFMVNGLVMTLFVLVVILWCIDDGLESIDGFRMCHFNRFCAGV